MVALSDARVRNTDVVTLEDARDGNKKKNPKDTAFYDTWYTFYKKVEAKIFENLSEIHPEDITTENIRAALADTVF